MPTVGKIDGLSVRIYTNDHKPAHVHVIGAECAAIFILHCPEGPPELRRNHGFTAHRLLRIEKQLTARVLHLCAEWRRIHDQPRGI
jgi:hypothetical protein